MVKRLSWCGLVAISITLPGALLVIPTTQLAFTQIYVLHMGFKGFVCCYFLMAPGLAGTWLMHAFAPWASIVLNVIFLTATLYGVTKLWTRKRAKHHVRA